MNNIDRDFAITHNPRKQLLELQARDIANSYKTKKTPSERLGLLKSLKKDLQQRVLEILELEKERN